MRSVQLSRVCISRFLFTAENFGVISSNRARNGRLNISASSDSQMHQELTLSQGTPALIETRSVSRTCWEEERRVQRLLWSGRSP